MSQDTNQVGKRYACPEWIEAIANDYPAFSQALLNGYTEALKQVYDAAVEIERAVGTPSR